jgi:hypothetical protein
MSNQGEFRSGGVTRLTALLTPSASLRGQIFYLSQQDGDNKPGYYIMSEDELEWASIGTGQGKIYLSSLVPTPGQTSKNVGVNDDGGSAGTIVVEATGNTDLVTVYIRAIGESTYRPAATLRVFDDGQSQIGGDYAVTFGAPDNGGPEWETSVAVDVGDSSGAPYDVTIEVEHEDGARAELLYHVVFGPVVTNITFVSPDEAIQSGHTSKYPLTGWSAQQSEVKSGDTVYFKVETDPAAPEATEIYVYGQGGDLRTSTIGTLTAVRTVDAHNKYYSMGVTNGGTSPVARGIKIKAAKSDGVYGEDFTSSDTLLHNNVTPSCSIGGVFYPGGQTALKDSEAATFGVIISNADNVRPPEAELVGDSLVIDSTPSSSGGTVNVHRNSGSSIGLMESGSNYRIQSFRSANGRTSSWASALVWIQDDIPTASVSEPAARLRSGGNDGTSIQSHTISMSINQNITAAPTLDLGHVPVSGGWASSNVFSGSAYSWSNTLRVHDNDPKGTFSWGTISVTNRAGRSTSVITGDTNYTLGGFVERTFTVDPYANSNQYEMGVNISSVSNTKLQCFNGGELLDWDYYPDEDDHNDGYTILDAIDGAVSATGHVWKSVDATRNSAATVPYDVRMEELV